VSSAEPHLSPSRRQAGSFRDPAGYVFCREGALFRAVGGECREVLSRLTEGGLLTRLMERGQIVPTGWVAEESPLCADLRRENPGFDHFLAHERLPRLAFPYEWSFSMLADAALLTLDLQLELLGHGVSLKDASAYNVQFRRGRPVFIDLGSFEKPRRLDVWFALGQFQRHFLFPLLLARHRGWDLPSYFLPHLDGLPIARVAEAFRGLGRWRPGLLLDLTLPLLMERKAARSGDGPRWATASGEGSGRSDGQALNLRRLHRKITGLKASHRIGSPWRDYPETCAYSEATTGEKKRLIGRFLAERRPATVLDLGCNTGEYSYLAAAGGAEVIAADGDDGAIETLYRRLQATPAAILPMVVDLANPSPAIGYMNEEREGFLTRARSECVFALALIHHLLVSANFPLPAIRDLFAALAGRYLVLEFVPPEDAQFQRLLRFRENLFSHITLPGCLEVFSTRFTLLEKQPIPDSGRTLLFFEKR